MVPRIAFYLVLLSAAWDTPVSAQDPATVQSRDRDVEVTLSGSIDLHAAVRDGAFNEALENFSLGLVGPAGVGHRASDQNALGRFTLQADVRLPESMKLVLRLQNRVMDGDANGNGRTDSEDTLGLAGNNTRFLIENAYVHARNVLWPELSVQSGVIDLTYKLRPLGEPFLIQINRSESSFSTNTAGTAVRNITRREELESAGFKARWDGMVWAADAFAVTVREGGNSGADEGLAGLFVEFLPQETLSLTALAMINYGAAKGAEVWTAGAGADYHVSDMVEVFGEAYAQFGTLTTSPRSIGKKSAFGLEGGVRITRDTLWGEASIWFMTGDEDPNDGEDNAFQSYENVNQFLIVEDAVFGLDIDTNLRAFKGTVGYGPYPVGADKNLHFRIDAGFFEFDEKVYDAGGLPLIDKTGFDLGTEVDGTVTLEYGPAVTLQVKAAVLFDSEVLEALTRDSDDQTILALLTLTAQF